MVRASGNRVVSSRRATAWKRGALALAGVVLSAGVQGGPPGNEPRSVVLRGPWSGESYREVREGRTKWFVGPDGTRYANPQAVVEAEALRLDPLQRMLAGDLSDLARDADRGDERVLVTLLFREQPLHDAGAKARGEIHEELRGLLARSREILDRIAPLRTAVPERSRAPLREVLDEEDRLLTDSEKLELRRNRDRVLELLAGARREALATATAAVDASQAAVRSFLHATPGATFVSRSVGLNALTAWVPARLLERLGSEFPEVARISRDRRARAALDTSPLTMGADDWWTRGYTGSSSTPVAILDTGIDSGHPALSGGIASARVFHAAAQYDNDYYDSTTNPDDYDGHGTHVAGIAGSADATYTGVAYGATLVNAKTGYADWYGDAWAYDSDVRAGGDWAANVGAAAMNYSFGGGGTSLDGSEDLPLFFDAVVFALSIPVTISAGNEGPGSGTLSIPADGFNVIAVGNFDDNDSAGASDDFLSSSSSRGPTDDGRRKPDLSAPGEYIMSCNTNWEGSSPNFVEMNGTSMAAPHVAGACAVLLDYGAAAYPEGLKALLIGTCAHTSPYNTSPDDRWGFGAVDLGRAYTYRASVVEGTLAASGPRYVFLRPGSLSAGGRVTLVWNRHVASNGSSAVTSYQSLLDLDLYVYDETSGASLGASDSSVDSVEQVAVSSASTSPVVQVYRYGSFPSAFSTEYWAIAAESTSATSTVAPPALTCSFSGLPAATVAGATFTVAAPVRNAGGLRAFAPVVTLTLPAGYTIVSGSNPQTLGNIAAGATSTASWQVRAPTGPAGSKTLQVDATSTSYEETYDATASAVQFLDLDAPSGSVSAPAFVNQASVAVTLSATDATSGVAQMRLRDAAAAWGAWTSYASAATIPLTPGEGAKTVEAEFQDMAGNLSAVASTSVGVDTGRPTGTISIAGGAAFTNTREVDVSLVASDAVSGVQSVRFSNDGTTWRNWRAFATVTPETLPSAEGERSVFVQFADGAGNLSDVASDTITLDTIAPAATFALAGGGLYTRPWLPLTADLSLMADLSGVGSFRYSLDGGTAWTAWLPYDGTPPVVDLTGVAADRAFSVVLQLRDRAGNVSNSLTDGIYLVDPASPDASRGSSVRGALTAGVDIDAYRLDLVAGQTLSVKSKSRGFAKGADFNVALDLWSPSGQLLASGRYPVGAPRAGISGLPVGATGTYWLFARAEGSGAAVGGKYTLGLKVATPAGLLRRTGTAVPGTGSEVEIAWDAASGWGLTGTLGVGPATPVTLESEGVAPWALPALRPAPKGRSKIAAAIVLATTGAHRLVLDSSAPVTYDLRLSLPKRTKLLETP